MTITEGSLKFEFPEHCITSKYDDWSHYRKQFENKCSTGNKAIDFIAIEANQTLWLCEIKDFRIGQRNLEKLPLEQEIALKVKDTLAGIVSAKFKANNPIEKNFAEESLKCKNIRIVLHIEQPDGIRQIYNLSDLKDKLKRLLKAIDPHVVISTCLNQKYVPWTITESSNTP